ncbi:MAG: LamG-like jellyroll fold domain-containing protein, partial [Bacteroidota bacterium]
YISLNPLNKDELWVVARSGDVGENVFQTTDGGQTWINRSDDLHADGNLRDVLVQGASDIVYVASRTGVSYFDKSTDTWTAYDTDLPTITNAFRLLPFYRDSKLRLATYGRGIWEIDFAQPSELYTQAITSSDTVYCSRDTVQFDSYSIADHEGLEWSWEITPAPLWLEDTNIRNPRVVLGENGSYDVRLRLTNIDQSSTYTLPEMVTVASVCEADSIPDRAVSVSENGDWVQLPDMGLNDVQAFSMTAWVKTNDIQPSYSGILMNDGDAAGLNFLNNDDQNNTLAYHWPGGDWWWNSGLEVPVGEWTYVALVAQPGSITVYVNGVAATHSTDIAPVDLETMKIGSYKGWGGRNMNAEIEEVAIWNRALSEHEVRSYRHLTKEKLIGTAARPLVYYQFNGAQERILDRVGTLHATLAGDAEKIISTAPIGGGASQDFLVSAGAQLNHPDVGFSASYDDNFINEGLIYVSRINQLPFAHQDDREGTQSYWIINDYSAEGVSAPAQLRLTALFSEPSEEALAIPLITELRQRAVHDFTDSWSTVGNFNGAYGPAADGYEFLPQTGLNMEGQYTIWRDDVVSSSDVDAEQQLGVFPNPVSDVLFVPFSGKKQLYNEQGQLLRSFTDQELPVQDLPAGVYTIRLGTRSVGFVKE